jgi:biopolymer transport protein ExbD
MRRNARPAVYDELNVTPLMDLSWTLLVVFIIMATATVEGIDVDLPKASAAVAMSKPSTRAITVANDGRIYLDTTQVSLPMLERELKGLVAADPGLPVVVKADQEVRYNEVVAVLDVARQAGVANVGLVTQRLVR